MMRCISAWVRGAILTYINWAKPTHLPASPTKSIYEIEIGPSKLQAPAFGALDPRRSFCLHQPTSVLQFRLGSSGGMFAIVGPI